MVAVTPDLPGQLKLPVSVSRPVGVADLPWHKTPFPGIEQKILLRDEERGLITALVRMAPAAARARRCRANLCARGQPCR